MCKVINDVNVENLIEDTLQVALYTVDGDYENNVNVCGIETMIELWQHNKYPLYEFLGHNTRVEKNYEAMTTYRDYAPIVQDWVDDVYSYNRVKYNREMKKLEQLTSNNTNVILRYNSNPFCYIMWTINSSECFDDIQNNVIGEKILKYQTFKQIVEHEVYGQYKCMKNIKGQKFSKWLRKFLNEFVIDLHRKNLIADIQQTIMLNEVEMISQYYSHLLEKIRPMKKSYKVVLSIDPRDYMRCSHGTNWDSCHQLGNMHGDGAIEYCVSPMALIAYIEDVEKNSVNEDCTPLVWREIVYCDLTHNRFIGSRQYRHVDKNATHAIQDIIRECGKSYGLEYTMYDNSNTEKIQARCRKNIKTGRYDYAYNDITLYSGLDNELWILETEKTNIDDIIVNCVEKIPCLDCGCLFEGHRDYFFMCENCGGGHWCDCCEEYHHEDDMIWVESVGEYLCSWCVENYYSWCEHCEEYHHNDDMTYIDATGEYVCENCRDNHYSYCNECDCWEKNEDMSCLYDEYGEEHWVCSDCYDRVAYTCENCGETFYNTDAYENLVCCEECNNEVNEKNYEDDEDEDEE